jgi:ATP-binding cassette subfamily A (ABC1) protein 1
MYNIKKMSSKITVDIASFCVILQGGEVISRSSSSVLLVFFTVFAIATIAQCFMFSVFFSRANMAAACAAIFYFIGYLPYSFCVNWEDIMTTWQKFLAVS